MGGGRCVEAEAAAAEAAEEAEAEGEAIIGQWVVIDGISAGKMN